MKKRDALENMLPPRPEPVPRWLVFAAGVALGTLAHWLLS